MAQRTVRFYQIVNQDKEPFSSEFPFDDVRSAIRGLLDDEAYVALGSMEVLGSPFDPPRGAGARREVPLLALDKITRDPGLRIERHRNYRPLELAADETLAEPTFYSVFDNNVLAVMRNSGGAPTPASFRDYTNKLGLLGDQEIQIIPLLDKNIIRALHDAENITKFTFAVGTHVNDEIFGGTPTIRAMVRSARENLGFVEVEITIKVKPTGADAESDRLRNEIEHAVRSDALGSFDKAEMAYRRVEDGKAAAYDFLDEALVTQTTVELGDNTNQPSEPAASRGIASAYDSMIDEINSALNSMTQ